MKNRMIKAVVNINFYLMIVTGISAIIYTVLDLFNFFSNVQWLQDRSDEIMLLLVANIAIHLISEHYSDITEIKECGREVKGTLLPDLKKQLTNVHNEAQNDILQLRDELQCKVADTCRLNEELSHKIIDSVNKTEITIFKDSIQTTRYLVKQLKKCKKEVLDLTWSHVVSSRLALPQDKKVEEQYQECIKNLSKIIEYKEVFIFSSSDRLKKLKNRLLENEVGYSCAYFESVDIPLLQFIILDGEEVVFASDMYSVKCAIRNKELAKIFTDYYTMVWTNAIKIKEGPRIHGDIVKKFFPDI